MSGRALDRAAACGFVFVSHSRRDRLSALWLVGRLRDAGLRTWICGPELHAPAWRDMVFPQIERCTLAVVVSSVYADAADGVRQEIAYAELLGRRVVRFGADEAWPRSLPHRQCEARGVRRVHDDAQFTADRGAAPVLPERCQSRGDEGLPLQLQS